MVVGTPSGPAGAGGSLGTLVHHQANTAAAAATSNEPRVIAVRRNMLPPVPLEWMGASDVTDGGPRVSVGTIHDNPFHVAMPVPVVRVADQSHSRANMRREASAWA